MPNRVVILPQAQEMLRCLQGVDANPCYIERFYPIILKRSGETRNAHEIVMILQLAIYEFTKGMTDAVRSGMYSQVPDIIDSLVVDREVAGEAKDFYRQLVARIAISKR